MARSPAAALASPPGTADGSTPPRAASRVGPILASLLLAGLAFALLQTMVAPALPAIQRAFGTSPSTAAWVLTGFLVSASVATPIIGKLGDLHGKARVLFVVLLVFAAGSALAALANSIEVLILARLVQGVAGGVFPLSFGIIRDTFPPKRVPLGIGIISATFGIGGGIGLVLSGVIVDNLDVSWLFVVGLLGIPAAVVAIREIPPSPATGTRTSTGWARACSPSGSLPCSSGSPRPTTGVGDRPRCSASSSAGWPSSWPSSRSSCAFPSRSWTSASCGGGPC